MANQYINAITDLWNNAGTTFQGISLNVTNSASAADSKLLRLQIGGTDKFSVDKNGNVVAAGTFNAITLSDLAPKNNAVFTGTTTLAGDPASALQAATKQYVDGLLVNLGKRARVRAATTANITISTALNNGDALDGVTLATGDQVLVKNQSAPAENGVYVVGVSPTRAVEFNAWAEFPGSLIGVAEGSTNADTLWLCTSNDGGTLDTTALAFTKMVIAGELLAANNLSDVANAATAFANIKQAATETATGVVELATTAEAAAGSDTSRAVTAAGVAAAIAALVPAGTSAASQAEQEAGSATNVYVSPGRQQYHPSAAKFWAKCAGAGVLTTSYNVSSWTDTGTGNGTVNLATSFSSANWAGLATIEAPVDTTGSDYTNYHCVTGTKAAGSLQVRSFRWDWQSSGPTLQAQAADPTSYSLVGFGDQ